MMDMLKRFEESQVDGDDVLEELGEGDDDEDEELRTNFESVDLGKLAMSYIQVASGLLLLSASFHTLTR